MKEAQVYQLLNARQRRTRARGIKQKHLSLAARLRKVVCQVVVMT